MSQFQVIYGLARSDSTLLAGLFRQNSQYHADMSSPVASLINGCLDKVGAGGEFFSFLTFHKTMKRLIPSKNSKILWRKL